MAVGDMAARDSAALEVGIFDHVDRGAVPLHQFYEDRLQIVEAYDRAGFYSYHVAEHHFTPLGIAASPGIFLSSVAQRTKRLRFGPMVYCLPLYHPLRLAEEICMLDQISGGRFDLGVGRGISPLESRAYGENPDHAVSRKVYTETLQILRDALGKQHFSFAGEYRSADDVQMVLAPLQRPHPPLWMGVLSPENAEHAAREGMNILGLSPATAMRGLFDRYRQVWTQTHPASKPPGKTGVSLFIVVADTGAEARAIAERAYKVWHKSFHHLYHLHGRSPVHGERPDDFRIVVDELRGVAGTPDTVRDFVRARIAEAGCNYITGQFMFGDMSKAEALQSIDLFSREVLPNLKRIPAAATA
jgi:alkanesulfonate monooxygenase SsuD/methylene tetrahydromethanopterin reductase-like flavin-dependent oxidoreductase (luciferase family)